jgi:hypothetical protein
MSLKRLPNTRDDIGASALIIALSMLLIMGFAALVIDIGAGFNDRSQDQSAADSAALGSGLELTLTEAANPYQAAVDKAKAMVDATLGVAVPQADWDSCTDPDALEYPSDTIPGITDGSPCISFGANDEGLAAAKVRVRIPNQTQATTFGRVLGSSGIQTSAAAEASLLGSGASGAFPAAVFSSAGTGDSFCIKTGTGSNNSESCGDPSTGDFGNFQPYFYTEISPSNPDSECTSGNSVDPLSWAMANGIDHFLGFTATTPGNRENGSQCPQFPGPAFPNRVDSGSGYSNTDVTQGLISGGSFDSTAFTGRLTKKLWSSSYGVAAIFGHQIDNRPLWTYIDPAAIAGPTPPIPQACKDAASGPNRKDALNPSAYYDAQQDMIDCLSDPSVPDALFVTDLFESPRLVIVPKYHQSAPLGNNACCYDIMDFVPVFINSIWTANGPSWTCNGTIESVPGDHCKESPGMDGVIAVAAPGQQRVDSADAIVLSCAVLPPGDSPPEERCKRVQNSEGNSVTLFFDLELTR